MSRKCVPQLAVDERMVALFRIIDPDIESSGKHIDECRQIDPRAVDAAYGSRGCSAVFSSMISVGVNCSERNSGDLGTSTDTGAAMDG